MRWKSKKKQQPKDGDIRIGERFLLFPKHLDGEWRWLELAQIHQEYRPTRWMFPDIPTLYEWVDLHWVE